MVVNKNREIWLERIADYRSSGLSVREWCSKNSFQISTLRYWIGRFNKEKNSGDEPASVSEFVAIATSGIMISSTAPIVIRIGKISIEVTDGCHPDTLNTVMKVLGAYA